LKRGGRRVNCKITTAGRNQRKQETQENPNKKYSGKRRVGLKGGRQGKANVSHVTILAGGSVTAMKLHSPVARGQNNIKKKKRGKKGLTGVKCQKDRMVGKGKKKKSAEGRSGEGAGDSARESVESRKGNTRDT